MRIVMFAAAGLLALVAGPLMTAAVPTAGQAVLAEPAAGAAAAGRGLASARPVSVLVAGPVVAPAGAFGWPLAGLPGLARPFEPPEHPYGPGHRGVDLRGSPGQPVLAAGDGTVAFAGMVAGRPVISVDHPNGLRTTYEPVAAVVSAGELVRRGDVLGTLQAGHDGCPAAACLHWGVRRGDEYLDPLRLLALGRVRLLPMPP